MASLEILTTFLITTFIFAYIPGPAMLYTAAQTLAKGQKSGFMATLGLFIGGCAHIIAAAVGLTTLFHLFPFLYTVIKVLGACWLIWLGIKLIKDTPTSNTLNTAQEEIAGKTLKESILVEVLNPKTAIFYLAFLPQFINSASESPVWLQFILLGLIVNTIFISTDLVCVFLAEFVMRKMNKSQSIQKTMSILGGLIFISLGLFLVLGQH
ncbi:LysE family translocator [Acinetobacter gyllenbergii]|uniref:LysE family translocator n=1 Tax=Acinetobacter gyllenbergii TaxID=134534 RepID=UPI0021D1853D|nr:LysE family translocator [Acinetobacter gyllenbergii]MCU4581714.1 LysE family translocator [Acinetobacter gyllenbergii]